MIITIEIKDIIKYKIVKLEILKDNIVVYKSLKNFNNENDFEEMFINAIYSCIPNALNIDSIKEFVESNVSNIYIKKNCETYNMIESIKDYFIEFDKTVKFK